LFNEIYLNKAAQSKVKEKKMRRKKKEPAATQFSRFSRMGENKERYILLS
jgi:hypothetical protein